MAKQKDKNIGQILKESSVLQDLAARKELLWINPNLKSDADLSVEGLSSADIRDAEERLLRFADFIQEVFPETKADKGLIESPLVEIPAMLNWIRNQNNVFKGRLLLKMDSNLPIAGSVKARGGIYEILKHSEDLALERGLIKPGDSYAKFAQAESREFFSNYSIHVGSTGNLGLSIGIISASLGYQVTVHMSNDARQWKKDLLRRHGAIVKEYEGDYELAVAEGRHLSEEDPNSYFVDDENSKTLFYGYAVAAGRLAEQLRNKNLVVNADHPLFVYIPCGVGGAPGGIAYGLKTVFGSNVHIFFVEPVETPSMLVGMASGLNHQISVQDIGLSGLTEADGLAVGRPSKFVGLVMKEFLSGVFTLGDEKLYHYLQALKRSEGIFIEPSAASAFEGPLKLLSYKTGQQYINDQGLTNQMEKSIHIVWATGGNLVPEEVRLDYLQR